MTSQVGPPVSIRLGKAGAWSAFDAVSRNGLQLVVSVALARLLTPEDFGAFAIAAALSAVTIGFLQPGFATAVVRGTVTSPADTSALFWMNVLISVAFAALIVLVGPVLAGFFSLPLLEQLVWVAALHVVLTSLGSIQQAVLNRDLNFHALALGAIPATIVPGGVAAYLAFQGAGVWALVAYMLGSTAMTSAIAWSACPWRPSLNLKLKHRREVLAAIGWVGATSGLDVTYNHSFAALLGRFYGPREVGLFSRATATQQMPTGVIASIVGRVMLPVLAARASEPDVLRDQLRRAISLTMLLNLPIMIGLSLTSDLVVNLLFGEKWMAAAAPLAILALAGALFPMQMINIQLILAMNRLTLFFRQEVLKKLLGFSLIILGSWWSVQGLAWAQVVAALLALLINCQSSRKLISYGFVAQVRDLGRVFLAAAFMTVAVVGFRNSLNGSVIIELAGATVIGALSFLASCWVLRVAALNAALQLVSLPRRKVIN